MLCAFTSTHFGGMHSLVLLATLSAKYCFRLLKANFQQISLIFYRLSLRPNLSHLGWQSCLQLVSCMHTINLWNKKELRGCLKYVSSLTNVPQIMQIFEFYNNVSGEPKRCYREPQPPRNQFLNNCPKITFWKIYSVFKRKL